MMVSKYIEQEAIETWQIDGDEPRPDWVDGWFHKQDGWIVLTSRGTGAYTDKEFRQIFKSDESHQAKDLHDEQIH